MGVRNQKKEKSVQKRDRCGIGVGVREGWSRGLIIIAPDLIDPVSVRPPFFFFVRGEGLVRKSGGGFRILIKSRRY